MIASTKRESTRAVSATVSPRPSCIETASITIVVPPSWRIAMSNDTRVRLEFFSKIIASVRPARKSGVAGQSVYVRVDLGGRRIRNTKTKINEERLTTESKYSAERSNRELTVRK